jgi:uncharacterized protein (TIGR00369 family)
VIELPHTSGCVVCGRGNPHGLRLSLFVDPVSSIVSVPFTPQAHHIGFDGIVHGGVIATVVDEAMVWAATWAGKRFCVCGEMSVRFRQNSRVGARLTVTAKIDKVRPRLITTTSEVIDDAGQILATASGKYVPIPAEQHQEFVGTFVESPSTAEAAELLRKG